MASAYVHGYDQREAQRLYDQATTLVDLLHADTAFPAGSTVLEAGCGVGAQTVTIAERSRGAHITSIDLSEASLRDARKAVEANKCRNVTLLHGDILKLNFSPASFDHVFVCFVLEHLPQPMDALKALKHVLKPGGTITAIEGDHGSTFFFPDSEYARRAIQCQVTLQAKAGGRCADRTPALSLASGCRVSRRTGFAADGLCRRDQAGNGRRVHAKDIHGHDRGRSQAGPGP